jgi:ketosteroid isomerase-like protein
MTNTEADNIVNEVKRIYDEITGYAEKTQLDSFLSYYDDSSDFMSFSSNGKMSNFEEFKKACTEYYNSLKEQKVVTTHEKFNVVDANLVIVGWTGNITATLKNGDKMKMDNYSITSVFKKMNGKWKVIHDHESSLPPEIIKNE